MIGYVVGTISQENTQYSKFGILDNYAYGYSEYNMLKSWCCFFGNNWSQTFPFQAFRVGDSLAWMILKKRDKWKALGWRQWSWYLPIDQKDWYFSVCILNL